jgi:hypothetical protein
MIYLDTETCGFHGPAILIQWAKDDSEVELFCPWERPVKDTLELIESICLDEGGVVAFNLAFDWFHICKLYTTFSLLEDKDALPDPEEVASVESKARDGYCLKPTHALDLMLHARKGPYQSTMDRDDIVIKRVPSVLAYKLAALLDSTIKFRDINFSKRKNSTRWKVRDIVTGLGDINADFKDVVLQFAPSTSLKALVKDALHPDLDITTFEDVALPEQLKPVEYGYAPFATAGCFIGKNRKYVRTGPGNWRGTWPEVIHSHISYWRFNPLARKYAANDVIYLRELYEHFGRPEVDDDDSILACMVAAVRWRGLKINIPGIIELRREALAKVKELKDRFNFNSSEICYRYLSEVMGDEKLALMVDGKVSTKALLLEEISRWTKSTVCPDCEGQGCINCEDGIKESTEPHPAAERAREILDARHAHKEVQLYDKLLMAGRFHASFEVIGALSSRMSGRGGGLNAQGINKEKRIRKQFPLAPDGMILNGGDFDSFEVNIVDAVYSDPKLREELLSGKKIHGILGTFLFPPMTYDEVCATNGLGGEKDKYKRSKNGVFALIYMGNEHTLHTRVGIPPDVALQAMNRFLSTYTTFAKERQRYFDMFCSMRQPNGIGTQVEWADPKDYIETMLGFRRYFTLENMVCKFLYDLANKPPPEWKSIKIRVKRRDREQSVAGAVQSALYASAFALQAANMRAAGNHVIQGTGAQLTKKLQRRLWELQPSGINHWRIMLLNIHDEVMAPTLPAYVDDAKKVVTDFISEYKKLVPLLAMTWNTHLKDWAG